ncbi:MAG: GNAT family N-acetyltransferase [Patescibacteria group bacterium]|nr:GNAT family N-acetyltransferase [Patescibacteria group bacterium]
MLRKGKKADVNKLARIHFLELESDFLPSLGEKFLRLLYLNLIQSKDIYIWVEDSNGNIRGFVVGSENFDVVFKQIIIKNFIKYIFLILPQILKKPAIINNIIETLFYTRRVRINASRAELIVISVLKKYQRIGLGKGLVFALEETFISKKIKQYKVSVNAANLVANTFYSSLNFKKVSNFFLYGKKINLYIKKLK